MDLIDEASGEDLAAHAAGADGYGAVTGQVDGGAHGTSAAFSSHQPLTAFMSGVFERQVTTSVSWRANQPRGTAGV
ncbi:MAG: hypothetical protein JWQ95_4512 [Sphaerisporangium sp.]|nr:hypothetical protein [Sphaerisporangium sp.]